MAGLQLEPVDFQVPNPKQFRLRKSMVCGPDGHARQHSVPGHAGVISTITGMPMSHWQDTASESDSIQVTGIKFPEVQPEVLPPFKLNNRDLPGPAGTGGNLNWKFRFPSHHRPGCSPRLY